MIAFISSIPDSSIVIHIFIFETGLIYPRLVPSLPGAKDEMYHLERTFAIGNYPLFFISLPIDIAFYW